MGFNGEFPVWDDSFATATDLRTHQFEAVTRSAEGVVAQSGAGEHAVGILQNAPNSTAATVRRLGLSQAKVDGTAGGGVAVGDPLKCAASGKLVKADTDKDFVVAVAEQASTTDTQIFVSLTGGYTLHI